MGGWVVVGVMGRAPGGDHGKDVVGVDDAIAVSSGPWDRPSAAPAPANTESSRPVAGRLLFVLRSWDARNRPCV